MALAMLCNYIVDGKIHPVTSFGYRILGSNEETKEELWRDEGIIDYRYFMSK